MDLYEEVKSLRLRLGWTQKRMGEEMGFKNPQETIWDIENGRVPRPARFAMVRQFLDAQRHFLDAHKPQEKPAEAGRTMEDIKGQIARLLGAPADRLTVTVSW